MNQYIIPGILFSLTLFFAYLFIMGPIGSSDLKDGSSSTGKVTYSHVQNLREQTKVRMDLKKQQALLQKSGKKPLLDPEADKKNSFHRLKMREEYGPAARDVDSRQSASAVTLDQKIDDFLAQRQQVQEMRKQQQQEFVKRFIEESRKGGYKVEINDQMEIISVQKIEGP